MSANTAQQKSHWVLALLLLVQLGLMSYNARPRDGEQSILRTWFLTIYTPVASVIDKATSGVTGAVGSYINLRGVREENASLREELDRVIAERDAALEEAGRLRTLEEQLALPKSPQYKTLSADVVARDVSLWYQRLIVNRGTLDGVRRNMPIATSSGIVGRVISVGPNFAQVQVITDTLAGAGAMLQSSRAMGEMRGTGTSICEIKNIHSSEQVQAGETVVTSGLDRIYPKGLVIGTIESVESDPNGPWHKIIVAPAAKVDRVEHVFVLLIEEKDLKIE